MIQLFLNRHEPPICFVAHNGMRFDFPVLKSELQNIGRDFCGDLFAADTLLMFREISDSGFRSRVPLFRTPSRAPQLNKSTDSKPAVKRKLDYGNVENDEKQDDEILPEKITVLNGIRPLDIYSLSASESRTEVTGSAPNVTDWPEDHSDGESDADLVQALLEFEAKASLAKSPDFTVLKDPTLSGNNAQIGNGEPTQLNKVPSSEARVYQEPSCSYSKIDAEDNTTSNCEVTQSKESATPGRKPRLSYALGAVYERVFGCELKKAHCAEDDCIAMLRIAEVRRTSNLIVIPRFVFIHVRFTISYRRILKSSVGTWTTIALRGRTSNLALTCVLRQRRCLVDSSLDLEPRANHCLEDLISNTCTTHCSGIHNAVHSAKSCSSFLDHFLNAFYSLLFLQFMCYIVVILAVL